MQSTIYPVKAVPACCHMMSAALQCNVPPHSVCGAAPAVTQPHLVSNTEGTLLMHDCISVPQVAGGEDDLTGTRRNALAKKGSDLAASGMSLCNGCPCRLCTVQVLGTAQNRRALSTTAACHYGIAAQDTADFCLRQQCVISHVVGQAQTCTCKCLLH